VAEIVMLRDYDTDGEGLAWALAGGMPGPAGREKSTRQPAGFVEELDLACEPLLLLRRDVPWGELEQVADKAHCVGLAHDAGRDPPVLEGERGEHTRRPEPYRFAPGAASELGEDRNRLRGGRGESATSGIDVRPRSCTTRARKPGSAMRRATVDFETPAVFAAAA
jgi:hypothetical protein